MPAGGAKSSTAYGSTTSTANPTTAAATTPNANRASDLPAWSTTPFGARGVVVMDR